MSVFEQTDDQSGTDDYVKQLVELKGETFQDPQAMAKALIAANKHIDRVEAENADMKTNSQKADWAQEVISLMKEGQQAPATPAVPTNTEGTPVATPAPSTEDVQSLIEQTITAREKDASASQNLQLVDAKMTELFGTEAAATLKERSAAVGMSVSRLQDLAKESPTAFFALIGEGAQKNTNVVPQSQVNSAGFNSNSGRKNWAYYQKLRKDDAKTYRTPAVQNEIVKERLAQGEKFYQ